MLYSAYALEQLFTRLGYKIESNVGVQRYSIDNHLYWLSKGFLEDTRNGRTFFQIKFQLNIAWNL